jgi:hypothetical protein
MSAPAPPHNLIGSQGSLSLPPKVCTRKSTNALVRAGTCLRVGIAAYTVSKTPRHCGRTRSSRPSRSASSATNDGRPAMPSPAIAAASIMSTWLVDSARGAVGIVTNSCRTVA